MGGLGYCHMDMGRACLRYLDLCKSGSQGGGPSSLVPKDLSKLSAQKKGTLALAFLSNAWHWTFFGPKGDFGFPLR